MTNKRNTEDFKIELYNKVGNEYTVLGEYKSVHTKILVIHNICHHEWNVEPNAILNRGSQCPYCNNKKKSILHTKTTEQFKQEIYNLVGDEYIILEEYKGQKVKILFKHMLCGHEFYMTPVKFLSGNRCPNCNKLNKQQIKQKEFEETVYSLAGNEYTVLGTYVNTHIKILMRHNCEKCNNYEFYMTPHSFLAGYRCHKCSGKMKKTTEQFKQEVYDLVGNEYTILGEYVNSGTKIKIQHNKCTNMFEMTPREFLSGQRCPKCQHRSYIKTTEEFIKEVEDKYKGEYIVLGEYKGNKIKIKIKHKNCGNEFYVTPNSLLRGSGCPKCASSKGEKKVEKFLQDNIISFNPQYTFDNCKDKNVLPFDFAIFEDKEKNKLKCLIEYDGEFHYEPARFSNEEAMLNKLKLQQYHDKLKDEYCIKNNIPLIRIPYWEFKNIETILKDSLL